MGDSKTKNTEPLQPKNNEDICKEKTENYEEDIRGFLDTRIILVTGMITEQTTNNIIKELEQLKLKDSKRPIQMVINSRGGNAYDVLSIMEYMRIIEIPIYTKAVGYAFSGAAALLTQGEAGHRYMSRNSFVMLHELQVKLAGSMHDVDKEYQQYVILNSGVFNLIFKSCNLKTKAEKNNFLEEVVLQEKYLNATEAKKLNLIDHII